MLLIINPGSTSTKIAVYQGKEVVALENLSHSAQDLKAFPDISDQYLFRKEVIVKWLEEKGIKKDSLTAIVARGGLLQPIPSGVYRVNEAMVADLKEARYGKHASNLAALIGNELSLELKIPSFVVDPVVVDEMWDVARISGCPDFERKSIFHALNQKAQARAYAARINRPYEELNLIVVHLGGGISIGAHKLGKVVDVNNALDGEGPLSPERAGTLPATKVISLFASSDLSKSDLYRSLVGKGGLVAYLGTNDGREIVERINNSDDQAEFYYQTMIYQIAKEIGRAAAVLQGRVDAILLTGGLAYSKLLTTSLEEYISYLGPVVVFPGENEMEALALGGLRVLEGTESAKDYPSGR